jgi:hypothetical protein
MNERSQGLLYFVHRCAEKHANQDITRMKLNWGDRGSELTETKEYTMCYHKDQVSLKKYCGPDWTFHHWPSASIPSFQDTVVKIMVEAMKPPSIDKVGWFGNIHSPSVGTVEHTTRPLLKKIGDENPELFDIIHIKPVRGQINSTISHYVSLPDLVKYHSLIDIGGNGYSGRLKYLLFSKRPLLLVERNYIEYFHDDLVPYTHYIPVNMDLSNLLEQVNWMKQNPEKAREIALNAYEFALHQFTMNQVVDRVHSVYNHLSKET